MTDDANFQFGTNAKIIEDSISPDGARLTTFEVVMHRFVLAEFNTHRVFSRNSASSRAIPFHKQAARVAEHPAIPVSFPKEQRGMSGGDELNPIEHSGAVQEWLKARNSALNHAKQLAAYGVHKSVVNRILEPFMWHTVIATATDWDGFFEQRCHKDAQPEIRAVAEKMEYAYNDSEPTFVEFGQWHMPYIHGEDYDAAEDLCYGISGEEWFERVTTILKKVSAARCARVSYLTHDGVRSIEKDLELYSRLVEREPGSTSPVHWSPLEHVATPAHWPDAAAGDVQGNFTCWHQFRHTQDGYNR